MKRFIRSSALLAICFLALSSCEEKEDIGSIAGPQMDGTTCSHLDGSDLDLSDGFRGNFKKRITGDGSYFVIEEHNPMYPVANASEPGECGGVCGIEIEFKAADPNMNLFDSTLTISDVTMGYEGTNGIVGTDIFDYEWNYPYLYLFHAYYQPELFYEVNFINDQSDLMDVESVRVIEGLCVVENVDEVDPLNVITTRPPRKNPL